MNIKIRFVPNAPTAAAGERQIPEESKEEEFNQPPPRNLVPPSQPAKVMVKKPEDPKAVKSNAYDLEPDDFQESELQQEDQDDEDAQDLGVIGFSNQPPSAGGIIHSKTDINQIVDDVADDLNQSAEEIQFNTGGAKAVVDEDIINAADPDDDF